MKICSLSEPRRGVRYATDAHGLGERLLHFQCVWPATARRRRNRLPRGAHRGPRYDPSEEVSVLSTSRVAAFNFDRPVRTNCFTVVLAGRDAPVLIPRGEPS